MLQIQSQSLRPLTTAHLAQTMTLLSLPNLELSDRIIQELAHNPALELLEERICPNCQRRLPPKGRCPLCSQQTDAREPIVFLSPRDSYRPSRPAPMEDQGPEREAPALEDLPTFVLQQLAANLRPEDRNLAAYILYSLDEDGFLNEPPAIIARATRSQWSQVQRVIDLISHADPPGLATSGPRHALLVQLDSFDREDPTLDLARRMIEETFNELARHEHENIAERLGVSLRQVGKAVNLIQHRLNPYPARVYWGSGRELPVADPNIYHVPDIQITHSSPDGSGPLMVEIFSSVPGRLRVNPLFRKAMPKGENQPAEEWGRHLDRASLFVKCLQQRNNTMRRLMKVLVTEQAPFILRGPRYLKPMTRAQVAQLMGVHESTVSRAVAHKTAALPDGRIIPLAQFFDRSLPIRDRIRKIIENETKPLTDEVLAKTLHQEGINIARRTVAKYRAQERILPARLRHRKRMQATLQG